MESLNTLRWERIREANLSFDYIKYMVKKLYNYEVKESNINDFISNISEYKNVQEEELISYIESNIYRKLRIFSMKDLKKYDKHPIEDTLANPVFNMMFKAKNKITITDGIFNIEDLDSCYIVTYMNDESNVYDIRMSCIKRFIKIETDDLGCESEVEINVYDSVKFIVDLNKKLVFMYYNDINQGYFNPNVEISNRKKAFMNLFDNVHSKNLIGFDISDNLRKYFEKYLEEINNNDEKKLISTIETSCILNKRNSLCSVADDFKHAKPRLEAIKYAIEDEDHDIATLECIVNSRSVRLKNIGYIMLQDSTFQMEVMKDVWKEFFE